METHSIKLPILSYEHNDRSHFIKLTFDECYSHSEIRVNANDAAELLDVNRRTLQRWCNGTQKAPTSALKLLAITYGGFAPWLGWEQFRMIYSQDNDRVLRWILTHNELRTWWTPERIIVFSTDYNQTLRLRLKLDEQQETINALSTRQPPPIPCAEIIPLEHYQDKKN